MKEFVNNHPWMTFFLGIAALNTVGYIIRGPTPVIVNPPAKPQTLTQGVLDHSAMAWTKPITSMMRVR